ncbi:Skp1-related protein [Thalictrum thalictroides]|uniref:Skp1-related protein n=1 Tax=Thalictrum thalictroides TaxID=46969 RepID=A0A7J6VPD5_THATH|nr:Skp1-related protein [Thalictrum thalictroides]
MTSKYNKHANGNPLPNMRKEIFAKALEYNIKHSTCSNEDEIKKWDAEFIKVDEDTLFDLSLVAYYLKIKNLFDLIMEAMTDTQKGKSQEEISRIFGRCEEELTPEEEFERHQANPWGLY